ncbi:REP-associated tyrosine transposase [Parahaliea mediterranea]|uniref:Transposase n=1 Tax=Parahaliea mediterranea TaxID=651086 RepID=A0A939DJ00_9GAMM|nr:transposase [Parahaliea mediterranea]MBN7799026.1 transposase [Parahaliea mediterranea]
MSYDALNRGRWSQSHRIYAITTVTHQRWPVFRTLRPARLLIGQLRNVHESGAVHSLAWVVMPDHLHWLFELGDRLSLPGVVKTLKARTSRHINGHLGRTGSLWQRAYFDRAVRTHEDVRALARYIVANPLRAKLVDRIGDYPHWDCVWVGRGGNGTALD